MLARALCRLVFRVACRLAPLGVVLFIDRGVLPSVLEEEICL
jgi:hypothetical protein